METSITEAIGVFTKNILEILTNGGSFGDVEIAALCEAKNFAAQVVKAYAEGVDAAIVEDKAGRRGSGHAVERRGDERRMQTLLGEVAYERTYFKKAAGGYEYLTDTALGVEPRSRVSAGATLSLVKAARELSYSKASGYAVSGEVSRQTVMNRVRRGCVVELPEVGERRHVPELHIDADEAHITLTDGRKSEVPLISVYEGIVAKGGRRECGNVFHVSEYGKDPDELWEQVFNEVERRYDVTGTRIYIHGDGASWIKTGFEWFDQAAFVLDKYHKNKAIKAITAGLAKDRRIQFDKAIREALANEDLQLFEGMAQCLCEESPEREGKIQENARYLANHIEGISICGKDASANNGGCTEPHVSHILSARLSTRPMAWSKKSLVQLAPILAAKPSDIKQPQPKALPKMLKKAVAKTNKAARKWSLGLPHPDAIGTLPITGKVTGTQVILKLYS